MGGGLREDRVRGNGLCCSTDAEPRGVLANLTPELSGGGGPARHGCKSEGQSLLTYIGLRIMAVTPLSEWMLSTICHGNILGVVIGCFSHFADVKTEA